MVIRGVGMLEVAIDNISALNQCADTIQEIMEQSKESADHESFTLALETLWRVRNLRGACLKSLKDESTKSFCMTLECSHALYAELVHQILTTWLAEGRGEMIVNPTSGPFVESITFRGTNTALLSLHDDILEFFRGYKGTVMMKLSNVYKVKDDKTEGSV